MPRDASQNTADSVAQSAHVAVVAGIQSRRQRDSCSKAICREFRLSRKVVRKVIRSEATEFRYERGRQPLPRIDPCRDQLDGLLLANEEKPARERLTLIRIFEELRALGYEGSYDAVRRYAKRWRAERAAP